MIWTDVVDIHHAFWLKTTKKTDFQKINDNGGNHHFSAVLSVPSQQIWMFEKYFSLLGLQYIGDPRFFIQVFGLVGAPGSEYTANLYRCVILVRSPCTSKFYQGSGNQE